MRQGTRGEDTFAFCQVDDNAITLAWNTMVNKPDVVAGSQNALQVKKKHAVSHQSSSFYNKITGSFTICTVYDTFNVSLFLIFPNDQPVTKPVRLFPRQSAYQLSSRSVSVAATAYYVFFVSEHCPVMREVINTSQAAVQLPAAGQFVCLSASYRSGPGRDELGLSTAQWLHAVSSTNVAVNLTHFLTLSIILE